MSQHAKAGAKKSISNFAGMEFVKIPNGKFLMGSDRIPDEKPLHEVSIPYDYFIGRFPVTWEQYAPFREHRDGAPLRIPGGKENDPVVKVSWQDAQAFIRWLNDGHQDELPDGYSFRLPSEAEWEKAARGTDGNEYPWGKKFDKEKCNTSENGHRGTTVVGKYSPAGDSPFGAADMAGNVYEWTRSLYKPYPYIADDGRENPSEKGQRVPRGGSWFDVGAGARSAYRFFNYYPKDWPSYTGLRVAITPVSAQPAAASG